MDIVKGKTTGIVSINGLIHEIENLKLTKQDLLVNQVNIKSINNISLVDNVDIQPNIDIDTAILKNKLTATLTVGGVMAGEEFDEGTKLEEIIRRILHAEKALVSIRVDTPPTKVDYIIGDTFDPTGMIVKAKYSMAGVETEEEITNYTYSPMTPLTLEDEKVTITYTFDGVTKTTIQPITVSEATTPVYFGGLLVLPPTVQEIEALTRSDLTIAEMKQGVAKTIPVDEQYVTIAYKSSLGSISSIKENGFEAITDFSNIYTVGDYKVYCTADTVYDPTSDINYVITWGIN